MALVFKTLYDHYYYLFHEFQDSRLDDYPLVHSPVPMLAIIAAYMLFVLKWGPEFMKDRKPYDLRGIIRIYNLSQVLINLFIGTYGAYYSYFGKEFSFTCQPQDPTNNEPYMKKVVFVTYLAYLNKYLDLLDTVFFLLRKKNKQISFLHLYHHSLVVFCLYCFSKFGSGSHSTLIILVNNYVHVAMYGYYFLSSLEGNAIKYNWLKKYITQLQILQFLYFNIHLVLPLIKDNCKIPLFPLVALLAQNLFMLALFMDFYIRTYVIKKKIL